MSHAQPAPHVAQNGFVVHTRGRGFSEVTGRVAEAIGASHVQVGIANFKSQYSASWNYIMAASTIVAAPMLILFVIFQKQIMESIKTSGLK